MTKETGDNWKKVLIGLAVVCLSPFAAKLGNGAMGLFTTPADLKATNTRITRDSAAAVVQFVQLRDSVIALSQRVQNQSVRIAKMENKQTKKTK